MPPLVKLLVIAGILLGSGPLVALALAPAETSLDQEAMRLNAIVGRPPPVAPSSAVIQASAEEPLVEKTAATAPPMPEPRREDHASAPEPAALPDAKPAVPLSPAGRDGYLTLSPPRHARSGPAAGRISGLPSVVTIGSSLAVVLGLFLLLTWAMKRSSPAGSGALPKDVVEVLGRANLSPRQPVHLVRCGSKLLLVCVMPGGMETLTEITEPDEVQRLTAMCRQTQPGSATAAFRQVFQQFAGERIHDVV